MHFHNKPFLLSLGGLMFVLAGVSLWLLLTPQPAAAQCGSQASSCKNCHEVQGQAPVNNDGTGWHQSHAFGDFCYICHAGNQQAADIDAAHTGMVAPLSDVKAACQQCHPNDLAERAQVYAVALGVDVGSGGANQASATSVPPGGASTNEQPANPAPASQQPAVSAPASTELVVNDPNLVDYVQRYNQIVLGEYPVNWGNIILFGLIGLVVVGGGGFVVLNEMRLSRASTATKKVEGEYPAEVVDMLPAIAGLKSQTRQALKKILASPQKTDKVLGLIDAVVSEEKPKE
jgi:hypothetical protein